MGACRYHADAERSTFSTGSLKPPAARAARQPLQKPKNTFRLRDLVLKKSQSRPRFREILANRKTCC
jgi:hypothetical protein